MFLATEAGSGLGSLTGMLPILLVGVVFWVLVIRPQRKRQQERDAMLSTVSVGDEVVTVGGIFGEVEALDDNWADLLVGEDVVLRVSRGSIGRIATTEDQETLEEFANGPAPRDPDDASDHLGGDGLAVEREDEVWGDDDGSSPADGERTQA